MKNLLLSLLIGGQLLVPALAMAQDAGQSYKPSIETHANYAKVNSQHLYRNLQVFQSVGNEQQKAIAAEFLPVVGKMVNELGGTTERQPYQPRNNSFSGGNNRQFSNRY
jgi:hypothetical protein